MNTGGLPHADSGTALLSASVVLAALMQALDSTIANVALPYMGSDLAAATDQLNWVLTSYIVAAAIMTPATGWLEQRFGRRQLFVGSVLGFIFASMLCGLATNMPQIVAFRALQGLFGAPLIPLAQAVLISGAPPGRRGRAMALFGIGIMLGPILGPAIGGWLTQSYGWRWVFYVNVPIGLAAAAGLWLTLKPERGTRSTGFDLVGFAFLSLGVGALQMLLDRGSQLDWFGSVEIQVELGLAGLGFYLFAIHSLTTPKPLVAPQVFRDRNLVTGLVLMFIVGAILLSTLALLTPYVERLMGYPVLTTGLVLAPRGVGTMAAMLLVGRLTDRMDPRLLIATGLAVTSLALYEMSGFTPAVSEATLVRTGLLQGFGLGFIFVPLSTVAFATLPAPLRTDGTALFSLVRNLGSSVGISTTGYLLTRDATLAYARLAEHLSPFALPLRQYGRLLLLDTPSGMAKADLLLQQQAQSLAYAGVFSTMANLTMAAVVLIVLVERPLTSDAGPSPAPH